MPALTQGALARMIDHTLLKPEATREQIAKLCAEAAAHNFASVCVQPFRVAQAAEALRESDVAVCTVIGFPLGANRAEIKAMETIRAVADGATELDVVINVGAVKDRNWAAVENDITGVVTAARGNLVKVILETSLLSDDEITRACEAAVKAGARFVKTSTGFGGAGASVAHVRLMRETVGKLFGVKASGGIRSKQQMLDLIEAGANRIGTSGGVQLIANDTTADGY